MKFDSAGALVGWIGEVDVTPTGGAAGYTTAVTGSLTPGWCLGGSGLNDNNVGLMGPSGIVITAKNEIVVTDQNRLVKFSLAGELLGWLGDIDASPTGGGTGCAGAASGTVTPDWCTGGSAADDQLGAFYRIYGLALDNHGNLLFGLGNGGLVRARFPGGNP